jgi:uncharacterized membrane protein YebE (DUF533 family)
MSLKKMAVKMAIAFAAAKGYEAFRKQGGMKGLQGKLGQMQGGQASGGLGGMMGRMGGPGGGAGGASAGGLGSLLGSLGMAGATGGREAGMAGQGAPSGGLGGLLGGLAAMAGGTAVLDQDQVAQAAERGPSDEATAGVMIRAMAQAVRADGVIDGEEREVLMQLLGDANDPGDEEAVRAALAEPVDPEALARDVPAGHEAEVYAAALTAIDPDHAAEKDHLRRLANALDLRPSEVRQIHEAQGKPL